MKVVIFKCYKKKVEVYSNYGDDYDEVWHNLNAIEEVREMSYEEFEVLKRAVEHFNSKSKRNYDVNLAVLVEDDELNSLLTDFKEYEKKEIEKAEKLRRDNEAKVLLAKANAEARKHERAVKKIAKELSLSEDEVREMLAKRK